MKKILSLLCTLALVLGVVLIPGMFSASAAVEYIIPSKVSGATDNSAAGECGPYEIANQHQVGHLIFDYRLEAGAQYIISFDYNGDSYDTATPLIHAVGSADATPSSDVPTKYFRMAFQKKVGTYRRIGTVFNADDVINGENNYLAIFYKNTESVSNGPFGIKNIMVQKVTSDEYLHPIYKCARAQDDIIDGDRVAYFLPNYGNGFYMVFDYEINPNSTYKIEYEYKGRNYTVGGLKSCWTTVNAKDSSVVAPTSSCTNVANPAPNTEGDFAKYTVEATGAQLGASATNKYLTFAALGFNGDGATQYGYLKNVKVTAVGGQGGTSSDSASSDSTSSDSGSGGSNNDQYKNDGFLHPTYKTNSVGETLDGTTLVYGGNSAIASGFMTFDYQLEADAEYLIEMDYRGKRDNSTNKILIGATDSSTGTEFKGNTVDWEKGHSENFTRYWHVGQIFKANDVINGNSNYLALSVKSDGECKLKNIKITKINRADGYLHATSRGDAIHPVATDNGVAYVNTHSYNTAAWMIFDYELKADTKYQITFEYKGDLDPCQGSTKFSLTAANTTGEELGITNRFDDANVFSNRYVELTKAAASNYTKVSVLVDANDVLADGYKYLAIVTSTYETQSGIRNLNINEFQTDGMLPVAYGKELVIGVEEGDVTLGTSVTYGDQGWMKFDYELQPDTEYLLSYDFRGHSWYEGSTSFPFFLGCVEDPHDTTTAPKNLVPEEKRITGITVSNSQTFFTRKQITFNSNDIINGNAKYICLAGAGYPNKWTFKNIRIMKKPVLDGSNLLFNGDFDSDEMGETFWTDKESIAVRDNTQNHTENGTHALHITGEQWQKVSQVAGVESNGNYELSFWYKGTFGETAMIALTRDSDSVERQHIFGYEILKDTTDWKQYKTVINSGDYSMLAVNFVTSTGSDFYIDDVTLVPTTAAAEYNANTLIKEPLENSPEAEFRYQHYDAAQGVNMFENYDFEDGNSDFWDNLIAESNGVISIAAGEGYNGDNSSVGGNALKFSAVGLSETAEVYVWFDVKPNTQYVFSMWSRTPLWSQENTADIRWGFANPFDGESYFTFRENVRGYRIICNDNQWHRTTLGIDTKDNTKIAFAIKGANSTMYFDNLQFFENTATNKVDARPEVMKDVFFEDRLPYITNSAPAAIYVADSKNLIKNGTFEDADISFWNGDATQGFKGSFEGKYVTLAGWDGTVGIGDTGTSRGKALEYVANDHITGKPLVTTYLNVIEVEKNTKYTFVADYLITEAANGNAESGFGLAAYNTWNPKNIGDRINFKTNYDPNLKWQKVSYTFNTNNYDEVAFYVVDGGGAAYIDNVSLFKTSDGSETPVEDTPVVAEGEIESNEYSITEDTITGTNNQKLIENVEEGTTIKEILDTLENSDKIKVFDVTGKEVTDYDKPVATGMTFRLMDGISALDAAVVLIRGDVNYDGLVNGEDMSLMMKVIISMNTFENIEMLVTDIDGDGDITSSDVAYVSKHIGGDRLNPIIIE